MKLAIDKKSGWKISTTIDRSSFACPDGCGFATIDAGLFYILNGLNNILAPKGRYFVITKGCVCDNFNTLIGDASDSTHLFGRAVDIIVPGIGNHPPMTADEVIAVLSKVKGSDLYEIYKLSGKSKDEDEYSVHIGCISL